MPEQTMSDADASASLHSILVAADGSPHSRAAIDAAVRIAATVEASVDGLFVEDDTLLRTARLPGAREVRACTAPPRRLGDARLTRQLRHQARAAERALGRLAGRADVAYGFETVAGSVSEELRRAARNADLLVLGKTSTDSSRRRLGSTSATLLRDAPCSVLVLRRPIPPREPLLLYYDGSAAAETALGLALRLVHRAPDSPLEVLLPAHDGADAGALRNRVQARTDGLAIPFRLNPLPPSQSRRVPTIARQNKGLFVLPERAPPLRSGSLQALLYDLDRPLLVAR
jgi:nucleotide-binding universal stress UspA family protein